MKTIKRCEDAGSHQDPPGTGRARVTAAAQEELIRVTRLRLERTYMMAQFK